MLRIEAKCGREPCQVCEAPEEQKETSGKGGQRERDLAQAIEKYDAQTQCKGPPIHVST